MKFYLNNNLVDCVIPASITETFDGTLDSGNVTLKTNTVATPYAPMQSFRIELEDDNLTVLYFYTTGDNVEVVSTNPLRYKHHISLIQTSRDLSKHIVRNSVFSQPPNKYRNSFSSYTATIVNGNTAGTQKYQKNSYCTVFDSDQVELNISANEKIKDIYVQFECHAGIGNLGFYSATYTKPKTMSNLLSLRGLSGTQANPFNEISIDYEDTNNQTQHIYISALSLLSLPLNEPIYINELTQAAKNGGTNFRINLSNLMVDSNDFNVASLSSFLQFYSINAQIKAEVYYWSCYDILDLLLKRQANKYNNEEENLLFVLPESGELYNLLTNTVAPNFIFTQLTMYEAVTQIFELFDAIFYIDSYNVLQIEYFNQQTKNIKNIDFSALNITIGDERFLNGLVIPYQDARKEIYAPSSNGYMPPRSVELGVPVASDFNIVVPHEIQQVIETKVVVNEFTIQTGYPNPSSSTVYVSCVDTPFELDISRYVFEDKIWSLLNVGDISGSTNTKDIIQANTISYSQRTKIIKLAESYESRRGVNIYNFYQVCRFALHYLFGWVQSNDGIYITNPNITASGINWYNLKFKVKYVAIFDGRFKIESITKKYNGESFIDQVSGEVDLNALGNNVLGLSLKLGEPTLSGTQKITNWANRIKKGDIISYQGDKYLANVVTYNFLDDSTIKANISFVKNFNSLSQRVRLMRERRLSNISQELTQKSENIITNFVYCAFATNKIPFQSETNNAINNEQLVKFLTHTFNSVSPRDDIYLFSYFEKTESIHIPLNVYGAGNSICFEMTYSNPISAGYQTTHNNSGWFGTTKYFTKSINYADENGFIDYASIHINYTNVITYDETYPLVNIPNSTNLIEINDYHIYKQPNEIFALNFELSFLAVEGSEQNIIFGSEFINNNVWTNPEYNVSKKFWLYFSNDYYSVLDKFGDYSLIGRRITVSNINVNLLSNIQNENCVKMDIYTGEVLPTVFQKYGVALCDDDGNIYLAWNITSNQSLNTSYTLYFSISKSRI